MVPRFVATLLLIALPALPALAGKPDNPGKGNGKGKGNGQITYKVSEKTGALSVYGMGRFPVTLYAEQWERLDSEPERKRRAEFIKANAKTLTRKS